MTIPNERTAVLFQGVTMDFRTIFAESPYVQDTIQHLQNIWQKRGICNIDIMQACLEQNYPANEKTKYEQPIIFAVSLARLWELEKIGKPIFLGHSFGEYAAVCASGAVSPEDGFRIAQFRGQLAFEVNLKHPGLMAAISGQFDIRYIEQLCLNYDVEIANINSPEQIVVSGERPAIEELCAKIEEEGLKAKLLETGCPFHSRHFRSQQPVFRRFLDTIPFRQPRKKLLMNATAQIETNPKRIKDCLVAQLTNPVDFPTVVQSLQNLGVDPDNMQEIGKRSILKGFVKKILKRN